MNPTLLKLVVNWLPMLDVWWPDLYSPEGVEWQLLLFIGIDEKYYGSDYRLLAYCPALGIVDIIFLSDTASVYITPPDNPKGITA